MTKIYKTLRVRLLTVLLIAGTAAVCLVINSCRKPNDKISLIVNTTSLSKSPVLLRFGNANPVSNTTLPDFKVTISGSGAALVQMDGGGTNYKASHGFLPLSLISSASPTPTNPVVFNVYASVPGFAPISQTVILTTNAAKIYQIGVVEYAKPVDGTAVTESHSPLSAGVSAGTSIRVNPTGTVAESAIIEIPTGTQMLDASGGTISASSLNSSVVNYSPISRSSFSAIPGGYRHSNVLDVNGKPLKGGAAIDFIYAGVLAVNMVADNTPVKHFSKPVPVTMELNPATVNFTTGQPIAISDVIPVWSMNEETGQWSSEGTTTITENANGKLVAKFTTTHLSCFATGWDWDTTDLLSCHSTLTVKLHLPKSGSFDVTVTTLANQFITTYQSKNLNNGDTVQFINLPNYPQKVNIYVTDGHFALNPFAPILASVLQVNSCTDGTVDATYIAPSPPPVPESVNVGFSVTAHCSDKNINVLPNGWFYIYDADWPTVQATPFTDHNGGYTYWYVKDGQITDAFGSSIITTTTKVNNEVVQTFNTSLYLGHSYDIEYANAVYFYTTGSFTMKKAGFSLALGSLTAKATYDLLSNTLNIKSVYNMSCN